VFGKNKRQIHREDEKKGLIFLFRQKPKKQFPEAPLSNGFLMSSPLPHAAVRGALQ
jgi:hypothetical protein